MTSVINWWTPQASSLATFVRWWIEAVHQSRTARHGQDHGGNSLKASQLVLSLRRRPNQRFTTSVGNVEWQTLDGTFCNASCGMATKQATNQSYANNPRHFNITFARPSSISASIKPKVMVTLEKLCVPRSDKQNSDQHQISTNQSTPTETLSKSSWHLFT